MRAAEKWGGGGWGEVSRGRRRGWVGRPEVTDPENRTVGFQAEEPETPSHSLSCWTLDIAANRTGNIPA